MDVALALLVGYLWHEAQLPVPATSPFLRTVQQQQGDVCWDWLAERRNWNT